MKASVVVVGVENPLGSRWMNSRRCCRARAKAGRQVGDRPARQVRGEAVEQVVAETPGHGGLRGVRPRADHEVVVAEPRHEARGVRRLVLPVGVDDQDVLAGRFADAALH